MRTIRILWTILFLAGVNESRAGIELSPRMVDAGGGRSGVGTVTMDASLGGMGGVCLAGSMAGKLGYAGQLMDVTGLGVSVNPSNLPEIGTRLLQAVGRYDDGTYGALPGAPVWSVAWGPLSSVDTAGWATASAVYADTTAGARAVYGVYTGAVTLWVLDTLPDNYGLYAGDGTPDDWQIHYFGVNNSNGVASANPDSDMLKNGDEYVADTNPTNRNSCLWLTKIQSDGASGMRIGWHGGVNATQMIIRCARLSSTGAVWQTIYTNNPPTAISNNYLDAQATNNPVFYYRLRVKR
jgi:hypothetical protein